MCCLLFRLLIVFGLFDVWTFRLFADDLLFSYDCEVLPEQAGWIIDFHGHCAPWCMELTQNGHFVIEWLPLGGGALVNYSRVIWPVEGEPEPPPSLWVEYRYRSNRPYIKFLGCDGQLTTNYRNCRETVNLYGDTVLNFGGSFNEGDLPLFEFYTVRFESSNGSTYRIAVNGTVFMTSTQNSPTATYLQMSGFGGCNTELVMETRNEWDFVRYGTIGYGERIVVADPPVGFLDPQVHADLHSFTVTYDSPNFVYVNQIGVQVSGGDAPQVKWTRRLDNGPSDIVEIVLDPASGGLPTGERTVFTFTDIDPANPDHPTINTVAYTFQHGDVNADGHWNLFDFASLQQCHGMASSVTLCAAFDYNGDGVIDLPDHSAFLADFNAIGP